MDKTGGPAFPRQRHYDGRDYHEGSEGMTLRDYFAIHHNMGDVEITPEYAELVTGIKKPVIRWDCKNNQSMKVWAKFWKKIYACLRYQFADAMIAERNKK